jgi:hypothetical protein
MRTLFTILFICLLTLLFAGTLSAQWVQTSLDSVSVRCFATSGTNLFASTTGGIYLSTNNGTSWTRTSAWSNGLLAASGNNLFTKAVDTIYRSTNNGTSWISAGAWNGSLNALVASGENVYAGGCKNDSPYCYPNVSISTDNGSSWRDVRKVLRSEVISIAVSGTDVFAGDDDACCAMPNSIYQLVGDTAWVRIGPDGRINCLAVSGANLFAGIEHIYFHNDHFVYRTSDYGVTWDTVNTGLSDSLVTCFAVNGSNVFAGTAHGVFLTTNNGTYWTEANTGLRDSAITSITITGSFLFAGTAHGVWKRPLSEMIIDKVEPPSKELPTQYILNQNYPNPFNPVTIISYQLPVHSLVTLKVYDVLGRELATLVNEVEEQGYKSVKWDSSSASGGLSSGIYFYRLTAGQFTDIKKLLLIR